MIDSVSLYINFRKYGLKLLGNAKSFFKGKTKIIKQEGIYEVFVDVDADGLPYDYQTDLNAEAGIFVDIKLGVKITDALSRTQYNPFWSRPSFEKDMRKLSDNIQNILLKTENGDYIAILPICTQKYYANITKSDDENTIRICIVPGHSGIKSVKGVCAVAAFGNSAYEAIHRAYLRSAKKGYIKTPLRSEKKLSEMYCGLGWCTWNAFYHDVTEEKIFSKMDEFKEKHIPVRWIMIDDGWSDISKQDQFKITSIYEDKLKFPNGLSGCIEILKRKYGIEGVGVWHSQTAYWKGIVPDSPFFQKQSEKFCETNFGFVIPNAENTYTFFDDWHRYLKEQGVDFVKIDTQGNTYEFLFGMKNCVSEVIKIQNETDRSVHKNFNDNVINCMGMNNLNVNFKPYSALMRMSDDFFPDKENGFTEHILQNIYNSVFLSELFYCDFDMWWSLHISAKQNVVLRVISGGPIYLSDELGKSDAAYIAPFVKNDGSIIRCHSVPRISENDLFKNPCGGILRVENEIDGKRVFAIFNLSDSEQIFELDGMYKDMFTNKYVSGGITLGINDAEIYIESRER